MQLLLIFRNYFRRLPSNPLVIHLKGLLPHLRSSSPVPGAMPVLVQVVSDPYYLSLFAIILHEISKSEEITPELLIFNSVDASMGCGFKASLKRSYPFVWLTSRQWINVYRVLTSKIGYRSVSWCHPYADFVGYLRSAQLWKNLLNIADLERLTIDGILVGDLIIDTYLRFRPAKTVELSDHFLRYLIWQASRDIYRAKLYFRKRRPALFLSSYSTYIQHGVAARVAVLAGIKVVTFGNLQQLGKILTVQDTFHTKNPVGYRRDFGRREDKVEVLRAARSELEKRLSGGMDVATSYMATSAYTDLAVSCPDVKNAVVVYLHDFLDSPHIYPDLVFPDFWTWICFTIESLREAGIRFLLKRHPNQVDFSEKIVDQLRTKYPGLEFVPGGVTTRQLVAGGIACVVTVYGTIAHEAAYFGVASIACARHPHIAFDFCKTARTQAEYEKLLHRSNRMSLSNLHLIKNQVLQFYAMHNLDFPEDQRDVRDRLAALWKVCLDADEDSQKVYALICQIQKAQGFKRFVHTLLR